MAGDIKIVNIGNKRPHRDDIAMTIAEVISLRGTCLRAKVGCVITKDGRIISTGYNGSVVPDKHCEELGCDIHDKCTHSVHAEANAIIYAAKNGMILKGTTLYTSTAPCYECAKLIIQAGIEKVYWIVGYTNNDGLDLLKACRILVERYTNGE